MFELIFKGLTLGFLSIKYLFNTNCASLRDSISLQNLGLELASKIYIQSIINNNICDRPNIRLIKILLILYLCKLNRAD